MHRDPRQERFVLCEERVVLECECGERLVLLGPEEDWHSEGRTVFECECGEKLILVGGPRAGAAGLDPSGDMGEGMTEEEVSIRELVRSLRVPGS